jgi:hypothetical protein
VAGLLTESTASLQRPAIQSLPAFVPLAGLKLGWGVSALLLKILYKSGIGLYCFGLTAATSLFNFIRMNYEKGLIPF